MTSLTYPFTVPSGAEQPIYDAVHDAVLDQRLAPGTKLTEARLADLFGVSRTIVRMALLRLAHDHIVQLSPNRGASIASPSVAETRQVFEARRLVECAAMPLAAERAAMKALDDLRQLVRQEDSAFHSGDVRTWIRRSGEFHIGLMALADNAVILHFGRELVTQSLLMTALYMPKGQTSCATGEHVALIDALAGGDGRKAARLMQSHLYACEQRLNLDAHATPAIDLGDALGIVVRRDSSAR
jgi:DNA-binding GntR family transcriptional regulator